jgi:quercetin dioxygenase-like cupin family protein
MVIMTHNDPAAARAIVVRGQDLEAADFPWGRIAFFASESVGPAPEHSMGRCEIHPGAALPKHYHPNCSEIVHVLEGSIEHTVEGEEMACFNAGDTVIVPRGMVHQARNPGETTAVLLITFSAARREFVVV